MTLAEMRVIFAKHSGRYDLVDPLTNEDHGANFFIQSGCRILDRLGTISAHDAVNFQEVGAGEKILYIPDCSEILEVVWVSKTGVRSILLPSVVGTVSRIFSTRGTPLTYQMVTTTAIPDIEKIESPVVELDASLMGVGHYVFSDRAIQIMPAPAEVGQLIVRANYYAPTLRDDKDENMWSSRYPEILGAASLWALEVYYRNTEGANDWANFVRGQLMQIDQKELEAVVNPITRMEG